MEYKNYKKHAAGILKSPVRLQQQKDAMNKSRQSKAADMSSCNHYNQNNNIYNEWNTIADVAVGIDIKATAPMIIRKTKTTINGIQKPMWQLTLTSTKIIRTIAFTMNGIPQTTWQ